MLSLRKLELLWITTLRHILYHDVWVRCQGIRESVWQRDSWRERGPASNKSSSREQIDRRVHVWITPSSTRSHATLGQRQQVYLICMTYTYSLKVSKNFSFFMKIQLQSARLDDITWPKTWYLSYKWTFSCHYTSIHSAVYVAGKHTQSLTHPLQPNVALVLTHSSSLSLSFCLMLLWSHEVGP